MFKKRKKFNFTYLLAVLIVITFSFSLLVLSGSLSFSGFVVSNQEAFTIANSISSEYDFEVISDEYSVFFSENLEEDMPIKFSRGSIDISFKPVVLRYADNSKRYQQISGVNPTATLVEDNKLTYSNIFGEGVDLVYEYNVDSFKEKVIVNNLDSFYTPDARILDNEPEVEIQFVIKYGESKFEVEGDEWDKQTKVSTEEPIFVDGLKINPVFLEDADGITTPLKNEVKKSGDSYFLTIKVPYDLIVNAKLPFVIDPSIFLVDPIQLALSDPNAEYGVYSIRKCEGLICNLQIFQRQIAIKNSEGVYRPINEVVKVSSEDDFLRISWIDKEIVFAPFIKHDGQKYTVREFGKYSTIPRVPTEVAIKNSHFDNLFSYKYDLGFSNLQNFKQDLEEAGLEVYSTKGFEVEDIAVDGSGIVLPDGIRFDWQDAIDQGYELEITNEKITAFNVGNLDSFVIDPVLASNVTEDVFVDANPPGFQQAWESYIKFPLIDIPSSNTINDAVLVLEATSVTGSPTPIAYNCTGEWTESSSHATITGIDCTNTGNSTDISSTGFYYWDVTDSVNVSYFASERNITFKLNDSYTTSNILEDGSTLKVGFSDGIENNDYSSFRSKEASASTPLLNITYSSTDSTNPTSSFDSPFPLNYSWQTADFNLDIDYADNSNLETCGLLIEQREVGGAWSTASNTSTTCSGTSTTITQAISVGPVANCTMGTNDSMTETCRVKGWAIDAGDNTINSNYRYFRIDYNKPVPLFISPTPDNNSIVNANSLIANISLTEDNLGTLYYNWNGTRVPSLDGLVLWLPFSEAGGNFTEDLTSPTRNATFYNFGCEQLNCNTDSGWNSSGKIGSAIKFDGTNDFVNGTFEWEGGGAVTVSFWNYVTIPGSGSSAFGIGTSGSPNRFQSHAPWSNGILYWDYGDISGNGRISTSYTSYQNKWTHVVLVSEGIGGSFRAIYLDGNLITSIASSDGPTDLTSFSIGRAKLGASETYYYNGMIDEFMIWNRTLNAQEITDLYEVQAWTFNKSNIANSNNTYNISVIDKAGNVNFTETRTVINAYPFPSSPLGDLIFVNGTNFDSSNVTIYWAASDNASHYKIYFSSDLASGFNEYINYTNFDSSLSTLSYTDINASQFDTRFYRVVSSATAGDNVSGLILAKLDYSVQRLSGDTGTNWLNLPTNSSIHKSAYDLLNVSTYGIPGVTRSAMYNSSSQKKIICTEFSCPNICTDTNCNFSLDPFGGYQVDVAEDAELIDNWTIAGLIYTSPTNHNISLKTTDSDFNLNWVGIWANTSLLTAKDLLFNISTSDGVTNWNETTQKSEGMLNVFGGLGTNFNIDIRRGYEVSVTDGINWTAI